MKVVRLTDPSSEPVTLAEAKQQLRVSHTEDDGEITAMIVTARRAVEDYCNRPFVSATWAILYDGDLPIQDNALCIPLPDVTAIDSITYIDTSGVTQTWPDSGNWTFDAIRQEITPVDAWPDGTKLRINVTAGPAKMPHPVRMACLMVVCELFEYDKAEKQQAGGGAWLPGFAGALLQPYRERVGI